MNSSRIIYDVEGMIKIYREDSGQEHGREVHALNGATFRVMEGGIYRHNGAFRIWIQNQETQLFNFLPK